MPTDPAPRPSPSVRSWDQSVWPFCLLIAVGLGLSEAITFGMTSESFLLTAGTFAGLYCAGGLLRILRVCVFGSARGISL